MELQLKFAEESHKNQTSLSLNIQSHKNNLISEENQKNKQRLVHMGERYQKLKNQLRLANEKILSLLEEKRNGFVKTSPREPQKVPLPKREEFLYYDFNPEFE